MEDISDSDSENQSMDLDQDEDFITEKIVIKEQMFLYAKYWLVLLLSYYVFRAILKEKNYGLEFEKLNNKYNNKWSNFQYPKEILLSVSRKKIK